MLKSFENRAYPSLDAASGALAHWAAEILRSAVARKGHASAALPGGATPAPFLKALALEDLPWRNVTLLPTDERHVPADHPRSNERMMRPCLAPALAAGARWLSLAPREEFVDAETTARNLSGAVEALVPLDVVICGMGEDGHIASLFPDDGRLADPTHTWGAVAAANPAGLEPRLTLTPPILKSADEAALLLFGAGKQAVLKAALREEDRPVVMLLQRATPALVFTKTT